MRSGKYYQGKKVHGVKHDVHRLVMEEKLGRPLTSSEIVHHGDEDKQNNDPENLELTTRSKHARHHMTGKHPTEETRRKISDYKKLHPDYSSRKLAFNQVMMVFELHAKGKSLRYIGGFFGVDHTTILNILHGRSYQSLTGLARKDVKNSGRINESQI
ncbi:MAG: HNH endonuclease [Bacillota bacterium]|nr:HNH endonuclease [Bacillota bacterium]